MTGAPAVVCPECLGAGDDCETCHSEGCCTDPAGILEAMGEIEQQYRQHVRACATCGAHCARGRRYADSIDRFRKAALTLGEAMRPICCSPEEHERTKRTLLEFLWQHDFLGVQPVASGRLVILVTCRRCRSTIAMPMAESNI